MGKRELVLVLAFVVVGAIVYQVTAPPTQPGQDGFRIGRMIDSFRRGVHGRPEHASVQTSRTETIDPTVTELRVNVRALDLTVTGEDRQDVAFDLTVESNGYDAAEARQLATASTMKVDHAGAALVTTMTFPDEGSQHAALIVRVPRRLAVRLDNDNRIGKLEISGVAAVDVKSNRGESRLTNVAGDVTFRHRGGALQISGAGSVRLTVSGAEGTVEQVRGPASLDVTGSRLELGSIVGPLDVKSRGTELKLKSLEALKPPLRLDMQSGRLDVEGLRTDARVDGRDTDIRIAMARVAPLTVYNSSDDISVTLPSDGYTLDAVATDGTLSADDPSVKPGGDEREQRFNGPVRGGGPPIVLRNSGGAIRISTETAKKKS